MTSVDDRIRAALSAEDEAFLKGLDDERGLFAQIGASFHGTIYQANDYRIYFVGSEDRTGVRFRFERR